MSGEELRGIVADIIEKIELIEAEKQPSNVAPVFHIGDARAGADVCRNTRQRKIERRKILSGMTARKSRCPFRDTGYVRFDSGAISLFGPVTQH